MDLEKGHPAPFSIEAKGHSLNVETIPVLPILDVLLNLLILLNFIQRHRAWLVGFLDCRSKIDFVDLNLCFVVVFFCYKGGSLRKCSQKACEERVKIEKRVFVWSTSTNATNTNNTSKKRERSRTHSQARLFHFCSDLAITKSQTPSPDNPLFELRVSCSRLLFFM